VPPIPTFYRTEENPMPCVCEDCAPDAPLVCPHPDLLCALRELSALDAERARLIRLVGRLTSTTPLTLPREAAA
jgi:hypothetical protein